MIYHYEAKWPILIYLGLICLFCCTNSPSVSDSKNFGKVARFSTCIVADEKGYLVLIPICIGKRK